MLWKLFGVLVLLAAAFLAGNLTPTVLRWPTPDEPERRKPVRPPASSPGTDAAALLDRVGTLLRGYLSRRRDLQAELKEIEITQRLLRHRDPSPDAARDLRRRRTQLEQQLRELSLLIADTQGVDIRLTRAARDAALSRRPKPLDVSILRDARAVLARLETGRGTDQPIADESWNENPDDADARDGDGR